MKLCMRVVCMYLNYICSGFCDKWKLLDFIGNYFVEKKEEILNLRGQNGKYQKSDIAILQSVQFNAVWRFSITSYFQTKHSSSIQTFAFSDQKRRNDVTEMPLSQKVIYRLF